MDSNTRKRLEVDDDVKSVPSGSPVLLKSNLQPRAITTQADFPVHLAVFDEDLEKLKEILSDESLSQILFENENETEDNIEDNLKERIESKRTEMVNGKDVWHNTPLHIAIMRNNYEITNYLIDQGAIVKTKNSSAWTCLDEAISTGNRELLGLVFSTQKNQAVDKFKHKTPELLKKIESVGDFYLEIDWHIQSWLPFLSRVCPSDKYKVYKKGGSVRVDTTLVDFADFTWKRGDISFIFKLTLEGEAKFCILDNVEKKFGHLTGLDFAPGKNKQLSKEQQEDLEDEMDMLLSAYISSTSMPTKHISFRRLLHGYWGFRQPREEKILGGYNARVFRLENCVLYMRKRKEHLSEEDLRKRKENLKELKSSAYSQKAFQNQVNKLEQLEKKNENCNKEHRKSLPPSPRSLVTHQAYFEPKSLKSKNMHLGRPLKVKEQEKTFPVTVWMVDDFPLTMDSLLNLIQIITPSNKHFSKVESVMRTKLPEGFPAKVEMPIFPTISAAMSFTDFNNNEVDDDRFIVPDDYIEDTEAFKSFGGE